MSSRIKGKFKYGQGDHGFSMLLNGNHNKNLVRKDHPACVFYSAVDELQSKIGSVLQEYTPESEYAELHEDGYTEAQVKSIVADYGLSDEFFKVLTWLEKALFSLNTYNFCRGDTTNHLFPEALKEYLENRVATWAKELGDAKDFILWKHPKLLDLNDLRIQVRQVEASHTAWRFSPEVTSYISQSENNDDIEDHIRYTASILNRLSTYFFLVQRKELLKLKECGVNIEEYYWSGQLEDFPIEL